MSETERGAGDAPEQGSDFYTDPEGRDALLEDSDATPGPEPSNPAEAQEGDE